MEQENGLKRFFFKYLAKSTDGFSEDRLLGKAGFGSAYRGCLIEFNKNTAVALKRLSTDSTQGKKKFEPEVEVISRLEQSLCEIDRLVP